MSIPTTNLTANFTVKSGLTVVSDRITEWVSTVGNTTLTVPTGFNGPLNNVNTINGEAAATFQGTEVIRGAFGSGVTTNEKMVSYYVVYPDPNHSANYSYISDDWDNVVRRRVNFSSDSSPPKLHVTTGTADEFVETSFNELLRIIIVTHEEHPTSIQHDIYINGVNVVDGDDMLSTLSLDGLVLGTNGSLGTSSTFHGDIVQAGVYDGDVDIATLDAELEAEWFVQAETTPPTLPADTTLTGSNIGFSSFDVSYDEATDNETSQSALVYNLYTSTANNLDTVANVEASGTLNVTGSGVSQLTATNLTASVEYWYNILVEDEAGNKSAYTQNSLYTQWGGEAILSGNTVAGADVSIFEVGGVDLENINNGYLETAITDSNGIWGMSSPYDPTKQYFANVMYFGAEISGSATGGSNNTLVDTSLSMSNDEHADKIMRITAGSGSGEEAKIIKNTVDTFTINRTWDETVNNTSEYEVGFVYSGKSIYLPRNE